MLTTECIFKFGVYISKCAKYIFKCVVCILKCAEYFSKCAACILKCGVCPARLLGATGCLLAPSLHSRETSFIQNASDHHPVDESAMEKYKIPKLFFVENQSI